MIFSVKFESRDLPGTFAGKNYHYESALPLVLGDLVKIETQYGQSVAIVTGVNIPDGNVDARYQPLKSIKEYAEQPAYPIHSDSSSGCAGVVSPFRNR